MQRGNEAIVLEVIAIEGKKALHSVDAHDVDEPCVIDIDVLNSVTVHEVFPRGIEHPHVGEQT